MTDPWAEKNVIQPYEAGLVLVDEEWLEKLKDSTITKKEHLLLMREKSLALIKCNNAWTKLYDKLEAINDWLKTDPVSYSKRGSVTKSCLREWKAEGLKILEAEG